MDCVYRGEGSWNVGGLLQVDDLVVGLSYYAAT
jgi:hypothetical protein